MHLRLALLACMFLAIPVAATEILTDPAGDVRAESAGQGVPASQATALDLLSLNVTETPEGFQFRLRVVDLGGDGARADSGRLTVRFQFDGVTFDADAWRSPDNAAFFGSLWSRTGDQWQYVRDLPTYRDLASSTVWQDVARADLVGASGKTPGKGDLLENVRAESSARSFTTGTGADVSLGDFMPDDMVGAVWEVVHAGAQGEGVVLASPKPYRSSNGEGTNYTYEVSARLTGAGPARLNLSVHGVPPDWEVQLPGIAIDLQEATPATFPVRVRVPFRHLHGNTESFTLRLDGAAGWAAMDLGVHYVAVPQPAGHHPTLYLHSRDWSQAAEVVNPFAGAPTGVFTMNTLDQDLGDTGKAVAGSATVAQGSSRWTWRTCLSPALDIGIDMDLDATGTFSVPVSSTRPLSQATLSGTLLLLGPGDSMGPWCFDWGSRKQTPLAHLASEPQDIPANGQLVITGSIAPDAAGDYLAYEQGAQLALVLTLESSDPAIGGAGGAYIQPGASMTFPFAEYQGPQEAFVLAGETEGVVAAPEEDIDAPALGPLTPAVLAAAAWVAARRRA